MTSEDHRATARRIAHDHLQRGDALGWFEELYKTANGEPGIIPWADMAPNRSLLEWLEKGRIAPAGKSALVVGCGLGDDAEELARRGMAVVAFDISETAIAWCRRRFPGSKVEYLRADLFNAPQAWFRRFDFVLESYTLQVLPAELRERAIRRIARFLSPGGTLLVICRGRDPENDPGNMPWPLTKSELALFRSCGLTEMGVKDYFDRESPPVRRFRGEYRASAVR
jgi:SAM-dependent methyltransferase